VYLGTYFCTCLVNKDYSDPLRSDVKKCKRVIRLKGLCSRNLETVPGIITGKSRRDAR
jgi:hypothetical protein